MPLFRRKALILAKRETTYATDAQPELPASGNTNAILARNLSMTPIDSRLVPRELILPYFGGFEEIPAAVFARCEFEVEMVASGALGTAPAWGSVLRACGFSETINAGVSVVYAPVSANFDAVSIVCNQDGVSHKMLGARGSVRIAMNALGIPVLRFSFTGMYVAVVDAAAPTLTLTAWKKPVAVNNTNTTAFTLHSIAAVLESLEIDVGNQVEPRSLVGSEAIYITGRQVTGQISIEATTVAAKNWWSTARDATTAALSITHGPATFRVKVDAPLVQIVNPTYGDSQGITMMNAGLRFIPSAGNDEITITCL